MSQQSVKPIVCTISLRNASLDFAADVVVGSNDRPKIAELLYILKEIAVNIYILLPRWSESPANKNFVFVALILNSILAVHLTHLHCCYAHDVDVIREAKTL